MLAVFEAKKENPLKMKKTDVTIPNPSEYRSQPSALGIRPRSFLVLWSLCASLLFVLFPNDALAQTASTPMKQIQFIIKTGSDDLRGDS